MQKLESNNNTNNGTGIDLAHKVNESITEFVNDSKTDNALSRTFYDDDTKEVIAGIHLSKNRKFLHVEFQNYNDCNTLKAYIEIDKIHEFSQIAKTIIDSLEKLLLDE